MITKNPMQLKAFIKNKAAEKHMVTIPKIKNAGRSSHHRLPRPASSFILRRKASW